MNPESTGNKNRRGHAPVQLTLEEIKVLKDCRVNSVYYRGVPLGIASVIVARGAIQSGHFPVLKRWSGIFYTGMFGFGFFAGIASYRETCFKKIMALENSVLAEQFRQFQRKAGLPVTYSPKSPEFERAEDEQTGAESSFSDQPGLPTQQQQQPENQLVPAGKWDEIRQQSRQAANPTTSNNNNIDGKLTFDDIRKKNRSSNQSELDNNSVQVQNKKNVLHIEDYQSHQFVESGNSVLDFSSDDNPDTSSYDKQNSVKNEKKRNDINNRPRRTFTEGIHNK